MRLLSADEIDTAAGSLRTWVGQLWETEQFITATLARHAGEDASVLTSFRGVLPLVQEERRAAEARLAEFMELAERALDYDGASIAAMRATYGRMEEIAAEAVRERGSFEALVRAWGFGPQDGAS